MERKLSAGDCLGFGWETVKSNLPFFIGLMLIFFVIQGLVQWIQVEFKNSLFLTLAAAALGALVQGMLTLGLIRIALNYCDNRPSQLGDLFSQLDRVLPYIVATFLFMLFVLIGLLFLILPGVIMALRLQFFPYYIVELRARPGEALGHSWDATRGSLLELLLLWLALLVINLIGLLFLGIGLLVTVPLSMVALAAAHRVLAARHLAPPAAGAS